MSTLGAQLKFLDIPSLASVLSLSFHGGLCGCMRGLMGHHTVLVR